eukprot:1150478-Pelagomonas_calceolata.AAC.16
MSCACGFPSPEAASFGPREQLLYVPCIVPDASRPDYLATIGAPQLKSRTQEKEPVSAMAIGRGLYAANCRVIRFPVRADVDPASPTYCKVIEFSDQKTSLSNWLHSLTQQATW